MQVEKAMDLIFTKYMKALISYEGIHRKETFFFPKEAFRELLLNAVIHRDYMCPTPIQIRIYEHKIRIWNIGKMPADVPAEKLFEPHSSVTNRHQPSDEIPRLNQMNNFGALLM